MVWSRFGSTKVADLIRNEKILIHSGKLTHKLFKNICFFSKIVILRKALYVKCFIYARLLQILKTNLIIIGK